MSFVDSASDWYYVSVPAIINAKSYYIGPRCNGTQLYTVVWHLTIKTTSQIGLKSEVVSDKK